MVQATFTRQKRELAKASAWMDKLRAQEVRRVTFDPQQRKLNEVRESYVEFPPEEIADQVLDIVVEPDRSRWYWKDEDELVAAQQLGLITPAMAEEIRAEGERVIESLVAGSVPFSEGWESWRPNPQWAPLTVPDGWDAV